MPYIYICNKFIYLYFFRKYYKKVFKKIMIIFEFYIPLESELVLVSIILKISYYIPALFYTYYFNIAFMRMT